MVCPNMTVAVARKLKKNPTLTLHHRKKITCVIKKKDKIVTTVLQSQIETGTNLKIFLSDYRLKYLYCDFRAATKTDPICLIQTNLSSKP